MLLHQLNAQLGFICTLRLLLYLPVVIITYDLGTIPRSIIITVYHSDWLIVIAWPHFQIVVSTTI